MPEKTEAQKRAQQKYMDKFTVAQIRMTKEAHAAAQEHARECGESLSGFVNRAIKETIKNDTEHAQK